MRLFYSGILWLEFKCSLVYAFLLIEGPRCRQVGNFFTTLKVWPSFLSALYSWTEITTDYYLIFTFQIAILFFPLVVSASHMKGENKPKIKTVLSLELYRWMPDLIRDHDSQMAGEWWQLMSTWISLCLDSGLFLCYSVLRIDMKSLPWVCDYRNSHLKALHRSNIICPNCLTHNRISQFGK